MTVYPPVDSSTVVEHLRTVHGIVLFPDEGPCGDGLVAKHNMRHWPQYRPTHEHALHEPADTHVPAHLIDAEGSVWVERAPDQFQVVHAHPVHDNRYTLGHIMRDWGVQSEPFVVR